MSSNASPPMNPHIIIMYLHLITIGVREILTSICFIPLFWFKSRDLVSHKRDP
jgi:hypothetical protein